jgi:hypothetical protein
MDRCGRCDTGVGHHNGQGSGFGCRIKHVQFDPSAMPSRARYTPSRLFNNNSWEKGVAEHSSGMPFLDDRLQPIPVHEWQSVGSTYQRRFAAERAADATPSPATRAPDPALAG